jgi:hypothetical protein
MTGTKSSRLVGIARDFTERRKTWRTVLTRRAFSRFLQMLAICAPIGGKVRSAI